MNIYVCVCMCVYIYIYIAFLVTEAVRICLPSKKTEFDPWGLEDLLENRMATHSSILAWRIPWTEEPGRLQFMGRKESDITKELTFHTLGTPAIHLVIPSSQCSSPHFLSFTKKFGILSLSQQRLSIQTHYIDSLCNPMDCSLPYQELTCTPRREVLDGNCQHYHFTSESAVQQKKTQT